MSYYSSKKVVILEPPVTTYQFNPTIAGFDKLTTDEERQQYFENQQKITYLGQVEDIYYNFVPDSLELEAQPEQAEVKKLDSLDPEVLTELQLYGEYVTAQRYLQAMDQLSQAGDTFHQLIQLRQDINDVASCLADVLTQVPITTATDTPSRALETIKALKAKNNETKTKLAEVGL